MHAERETIAKAGEEEEEEACFLQSEGKRENNFDDFCVGRENKTSGRRRRRRNGIFLLVAFPTLSSSLWHKWSSWGLKTSNGWKSAQTQALHDNGPLSLYTLNIGGLLLGICGPAGRRARCRSHISWGEDSLAEGN